MLITVFILHDLLPYEKCQNIVPIRQLVCELHINPIRSGLFQTVNDPGGGGGGFKSPPPTISKTIVSIVTILYM